MNAIGPYDPDLEMFVQTLGPINLARLRFQRWLCESGRGEQEVCSAPAGELALAFALTVDEDVNQGRD